MRTEAELRRAHEVLWVALQNMEDQDKKDAVLVCKTLCWALGHDDDISDYIDRLERCNSQLRAAEEGLRALRSRRLN